MSCNSGIILLHSNFFLYWSRDHALGPTLDLGVGQIVNRAAQPLVGHTLTEFFGQVSRRLSSATSNY